MGKISISSGRIYVERAGHSVFDTSARSASLFPDSTRLISSASIVFPHLLLGYCYRTVQLPGDPANTGVCWDTYIPQEWGPQYTDNPATDVRNLPDVFIGSVPTGTDYLDVMVNVTRTVAPHADVDGLPFQTIVPSGVWFKADGGCCVVEHDNLVARMFEFALIGTNVYLRRYQSVGSASISFSGGITNIGNLSNNPGAGFLNAVLGGLVDIRGPHPTGYNRLHGGNNDRANIHNRAYVIPGTSSTSGTFTNTNNYSSTFSCSYIIHPGRINN